MLLNPELRSLTVIIPVYQNELNLDRTFERLLELRTKLDSGGNFKIVFVNDGSTDRSSEKLTVFQNEHSSFVRVIEFTRNFGQIAAIQAGFQHAESDVVGVISADLQDPPELFVEMLDLHRQGYKLIIAERTERDESLVQRFFSRTYWSMVNAIALPGYPTGGFDFCLVDRQVVRVLNSFTEKNTHVFSLIFSFGFPYKIVSYKRQKRELGRSQWTIKKKIKLFLDTFIAFSYAPIRMISYIGFFVSALSFIFAVYVVGLYLIKGNQYVGWTTISTLISFFGGLTLLTLGLIGEYLWRILDQVRGRPLFIVNKDSHQKNEDLF